MRFLGIDPDWKASGYALVEGNNILALGSVKHWKDLDMRDIGAFCNITQIDCPHSNTDTVVGVECAILCKTVLFGGRSAGELIRRGIGLAQCQFACGIMATLFSVNRYKVLLIKPSDWNAQKRKKKAVHEDLYLRYPKLRTLRKTRGNGINDDAIDAVAIAFAAQRIWKQTGDKND